MDNCDKCGDCKRECSMNAISLRGEKEIVPLEVGSVILATGHELFDPNLRPDYAYFRYDDVITQSELGRILGVNGPTKGKFQCLSDGHIPKTVVMIQCVGSRDEKPNSVKYCCKVGCMVALKNANIIKNISRERITDEFSKILMGNNPQDIIILYKTGILKSIGVTPNISEEKYDEFEKDLEVLKLIPSSLIDRLSVLDFIIKYKAYSTDIIKDYLVYSTKVKTDSTLITKSMLDILNIKGNIETKLKLNEVGIDILKKALTLSKIYFENGYLEDKILFNINEIINSVLEIDKNQIEEIVKSMQEEFKTRGIEIVKIENGYQLCTKKEYYEYIYPILDKRAKPNLSTAALETLAIIAYNQRATKAEIEAIRGVNSDGTIYKLLDYGLIEDAGKADLPGRPITYKTTPEFLKMFGYETLANLPELPKYKLDANRQVVIDELLEDAEKGEEEKE